MSDYLREVRRRSVCGACEAGVEHDCTDAEVAR